MSSPSGSGLTYTITLQAKGSEQISAAQRLLDQFYATLAKGGQSTKQFADGFTRGAQDVSTSTQKITQSSQQLVTSINTQKTAFQGTAQSTNTYKQALDQTAATQSRAGQTAKALEMDVNRQKTAFTGAVGSMNQYKAVTDQVFTSQGKVVSSTQQATQQVNLYKTAQQQSLATMQQTNTALTQQSTLAQTLKQNFGTLTLGVTTLTTGVFNLYNTYDSLVDTQLRLDTMQNKLTSNQRTLSEAQEKYNTLIKDGKASQDDIADAMRDIELAQAKVKTSTEKLTDAQEDLDRAWKDFYINTIPAAVQTLGGGAAAIGTFGSALRKSRVDVDDASKAMRTLGPAAAGAAGGLTAAGAGATAAKGGMTGLLAVAGPIGLAIAAIGGSLLAVNQNFLGFRDVLNNVGAGLGNLFPVIGGTLDLIKGLTGQLGISGEATEEWQGALDRGFTDLNAKITTVSDAVETALNEIGFAFQDTYIFFENFAQLGGLVAKGITDAITEVSKFGAGVKKAIEEGLAFMSDPNTWAKGWNSFVEFAASAGENAMKVIQQKINEFGRWVFGNDQWNNLVLGAQDAAKSAVKVIQDTLSGVGDWLERNVIGPARQSIQANIVEPLANTMPKPDENVQQQQQRTLSYQDQMTAYNQAEKSGQSVGKVYDDQNRLTFAGPLVDTQGTTPIVRKPPTTPQTAGQVPFGARTTTGMTGPIASGLASIGQAIFSDDSRKKIEVGTQTVDKLKESVKGLLNPIQQASAASDENAKAIENTGIAATEAAQQTAVFTEAYDKQGDAIKTSAIAVQANLGTIAKLKEQLAEGTIQAVAFGEGFTEAHKNFLNMQVATQKLGGEVLFLSANLATTEGITARFNQGFVTGAKQVLDWASNMDVAKGAAEGSRAALATVADTLGVDIPEGFRGSNKAIQEFIALSKQAGPEFEAFIDSVRSGFESMTSGLGDAIRNSNSDWKDEIEKMEEELGIEFNKGVKNALKLEGATDAIASLSSDFTRLFSGIAGNIKAEDFFDLRDQFKERIQETFEDIPEHLQPVAQGIMTDLMKALNAPVDLQDENSVKAYVAEVEKHLKRLDLLGDGTADTWTENAETISSTEFSAENVAAFAAEVEENMKKAVAATNAWLETTNQQTGGLFENAVAPQQDPGSIWNKAKGTELDTGTKDNKKKPKTTGKGGPTAGMVAPPPVDLEAWQTNLDAANEAFTTFMTTMFENAASIPAGVMAGVEPLKEMLGETFLALREGFTGMITLIIADAQAITPGLIAAFDAAKEPIGETLMAIRDACAGTFTLIISDAQGITNGISAAFSTARTQSQPHISGLAEDFVTRAVVPIEDMAEGIAETIGSAFETGRTRAVNALEDIIQAAENARTAIENIATTINNIPEEKTVVINIETRGSVPPQLNASGWEGVVGQPGGVNFTAGEAGPELVSIIPLGKAMTRSGKGGDGITRISAQEGFQGVVGADAATYLHGNIEGQRPNTGTAMTSVNIAAVGGRPVSSVGGILGGIPVTVVSGNSGWITGPPGGQPGGGGGGMPGGGSPGQGGVGGGGGGAGTRRQIDVNENGQRYYYYQNGNDIQTNMSPEQIQRYVGPTAGGPGSPTTPPGAPGQGGPGGGGAAPPIPTTQRGEPGTGFEVSRSANPNTAGGPIGVSQDNKVHLYDGTSYTIQQWNRLNDNTRTQLATSDDVGIKSLPKNTFLEEDYSISVKQGGTTTQFVNNTTYQSGPNAGQTSPVYQPQPSQPGGGAGGGGGTTPGQTPRVPNPGTDRGYPYAKPGHVVEKTEGNAWAPADHPDRADPSKWKAVRMKNDPSKWKVVTSDDKNIAADFNSEDEALDYIDHYNGRFLTPEQAAGGGVPQQPPGQGGGNGGNGSGGGIGNTTPANQDPDTWKVREFEDGSIAVVDPNNNRVAKGFKSRQEATDYIGAHQEAKGNDAYTSPTTGGEELDTSGGTSDSDDAVYRTPSHVQRVGTSSGGGGGGAGGGSPTAPSHVKTSGSGKKWQGEAGDPQDWEVVPMTDKDKRHLWKVINGKTGRNIATEFTSEEEAEEWLFAHQSGPTLPPGDNDNQGGAGGGGQGPPPTTTPPPGQGNGGGGTPSQPIKQVRIQENGQTLYYDNSSGQVVTNMTPEQIARYVGPNAPGGNPNTSPPSGGQAPAPPIPGGGNAPQEFIRDANGKVIGIRQGNQYINAETGEVWNNGQYVNGPKGIVINGPGAGGGVGPGGPPGGLVGGFGLPYGPSAPRVTTDTSIPSGMIDWSGSGYIGNEPGAGGVGRPPWVNRPIFGGGGAGGGTQTNTGTNTSVNQNIRQTQSWSQSSNIQSGGSIVNRGNNVNMQQNQTNNMSNVFGQGSGGIGSFFGPVVGGGTGGGNALAGGQYYDSWVVENQEGTERHPEFRSNMNSDQMSRMLAMMAASGQEVPYYTSGQPAITGFRYNGSGWQGTRPQATPRQLRTGRDNRNPIWDTGNVTMPADVGMRGTPGQGVGGGGGIGGRNPFDFMNGIGDLVNKLTDNILSALNQALGRMAININLNNSSIGDAQTRLMMRNIAGRY